MSDAFFAACSSDRPDPALRHRVDDDLLPRRRRTLVSHGEAPLTAISPTHTCSIAVCDQSAGLYGAGGQIFATWTQIAYFRV
jgi:hypothetical protein